MSVAIDDKTRMTWHRCGTSLDNFTLSFTSLTYLLLDGIKFHSTLIAHSFPALVAQTRLASVKVDWSLPRHNKNRSKMMNESITTSNIDAIVLRCFQPFLFFILPPSSENIVPTRETLLVSNQISLTRELKENFWMNLLANDTMENQLKHTQVARDFPYFPFFKSIYAFVIDWAKLKYNPFRCPWCRLTLVHAVWLNFFDISMVNYWAFQRMKAECSSMCIFWKVFLRHKKYHSVDNNLLKEFLMWW